MGQDSSSSTLLVGLTGGIASGKTVVGDQLQQLGAYVIDTDKIAREVVKPGTTGLAQIAENFGNNMLLPSGKLDRAALRACIFASDTDREKLNAILHPEIERLVKTRLANAPNHVPYSVIVIPLLVETQAMDRYPMQRILVVDVAESTQIERLMARDGITQSAAVAILNTQACRDSRLAIADDVINNDGSIDQLQEQTRVIHEKYCQLAAFIKIS